MFCVYANIMAEHCDCDCVHMAGVETAESELNCNRICGYRFQRKYLITMSQLEVQISCEIDTLRIANMWI